MSVESSALNVERSGAAGRAVFLSYASQDAEAAKRICDALRAAGVEVWFDAEGGLEHGDEWDAKIRKQVKECVLFIAVISANTQAREEGYFRLEWDMAAERARSIASGVAFILPVVVDDTREPDALVPDRFRAVQWTKLPGGVVPADVLQRFLKLWSHRTGALKQVAGGAQKAEDGGQKAEGGNQAGPPGKPGAMAYAFIAAAIAVILAGVGWWFLPVRVLPPVVYSASVAPSVAPVTATAPAVFPRDPDLKRAWDIVFTTVNSTTEDFALAEDIVKGVLAKRPTDPETVIVYAWVNNAYINRGFDVSEERYVLGRRYTERAVQLAPDNPEALAALGQYLSFRGADMARAEQLLRRAIELNPREPRFWRALSFNVLRWVRPAEAIAVSEHAEELFPADPLVAYELFLIYRVAGRVDDMERAIDRTLALAPIGAAFLNKSWIVGWVHGDVAGMKHWLDQVPAGDRLSTRTLVMRYEYARLSGQPDDLAGALQALQAHPGPALSDFWYTGPKALLVGDLYAALGQREFAKGQFEAALVQLAREKAASPGDLDVLTNEGWALLGLGRREEALADFHLLLDTVRGKNAEHPASWWFDFVPAFLLLGDRATALQEMKFYAQYPYDLRKMRVALAIDPRMAPFRDDPEIRALLAEPKTKAAVALAPAPDAKSVAVLAFTNLSDDKDNEYFSDGISEELLNVLAKVPGLKVTARTSSFSFKGKDTPIPEIARQLGVAYVVEGSVRKAGGKVRITAQLIKAADGFQVWSDDFTRELKDIFAVQDEIAGLIAKNLSLKLGTNAGAARQAVDPQAFELYVQARQAWNLRTEAGFARAEQLLEQALGIAPDFARAHAALADVWYFQVITKGITGTFGRPDPPEFARVLQKVHQALALDPASAEAHASLGNILFTSWKYADAEREYRSAIELNPNYASAHQWLAGLLLFDGRMDEALAEIKLASELDPLSSRIADNYAFGLHLAGRYAAALAMNERALALQPINLQAVDQRTYLLAEMGRIPEALAWVQQQPADYPLAASDRFIAYALAGRQAEAEALLPAARKNNLWPESYLLLLLGRKEEAIASLNLDSCESPGIFLDPIYDAIEDDPRFQKFIATIGWTQARERMKTWRAAHPPEKTEARK